MRRGQNCTIFLGLENYSYNCGVSEAVMMLNRRDSAHSAPSVPHQGGEPDVKCT